MLPASHRLHRWLLLRVRGWRPAQPLNRSPSLEEGAIQHKYVVQYWRAGISDCRGVQMAVEAGLRQELAENKEYIQCIRDPQLMGALILASCAMVLSCCCSRADPIGADER